MNITHTNNTTFQGNLNISQVKTNKARWQNVAKIFQEKTKNFPNTEMQVFEVKHEMALETCLNKASGWKKDITASFFTYRMQELFDIMSDDKIADVLTRLVNLGANGKKELLSAKDFTNSIVKKLGYTDKAETQEKFDIIYGETSDLIKKSVFEKAKEDSAMKNWAVMLEA